MPLSLRTFISTHWVGRMDGVVILLVVFVIFLRLVPTWLLGVPFLPDSWVHIGKAEAILASGHFTIWGDYDDHWPGLNVLIALFRVFPGLDPVWVGQVGVPLLTGLSLLFFYLVLRRLTGHRLVALVGVVLLGFAAPLTLIMGVTFKEGLARFFLMAGVLAFVVRSPKASSHLVAVLVVVAAIVPTHHISFLVAGSIVAFVMVGVQVYEVRTSELSLRRWLVQSCGFVVVLLGALAYYLVFGAYALLLLDARILATGLVIYFVVFGVLNIYRLRAPKQSLAFQVGLLIIAALLLVVFLGNLLFVPLFEATLLPASTLLLLAPMAATVVLGAFGYTTLDEVSPRVRIILSSWVLAILGLLLFALLSGRSALSLVLTYRLVLFAFAPVCALAAVGVFVYVRTHPRQAVLIQGLLLVGLLAVLPVATLAFTRDPFFGYGCTVTPPLQQSNQWLVTVQEPGALTAGDHLFTYYRLYYLDASASVDAGQRLFVDGNLSTPYTYVGVHQYLLETGFWLPSGVQWLPLHPSVLPWLETSVANALIFNNGGVQVYRRL